MTPLLDLISADYPVSQTYISILYGDQSAVIPAVIITSNISVIVDLIKQLKTNKEEVDESGKGKNETF